MSDTATVEVMAGARAQPESLLEHDEAAELEEAEAVAMLGVAADLRASAGEAWFGGSVLGWLYVPEGEASALRLVPAAGWVHGAEAHAHVDLAGRYAVEWAPGVTGGRAEVTARAGHQARDRDPDDDGFRGRDDYGKRDPAVHVQAVETCDGVDQDCDGEPVHLRIAIDLAARNSAVSETHRSAEHSHGL